MGLRALLILQALGLFVTLGLMVYFCEANRSARAVRVRQDAQAPETGVDNEAGRAAEEEEATPQRTENRGHSIEGLEGFLYTL